MGKTVFMFPGQGAQYIGMAKDFYDAIPECREVFEEASEASGWNADEISVAISFIPFSAVDIISFAPVAASVIISFAPVAASVIRFSTVLLLLFPEPELLPLSESFFAPQPTRTAITVTIIAPIMNHFNLDINPPFLCLPHNIIFMK